MKKTIIYVCEEITTSNVYQAVQAGELRNAPVFMDVYCGEDPVLSGRHLYEDGGWTYVGTSPKRPRPEDPEREAVPPACEPGCRWQMIISTERQQNALRMELVSLVEECRCGWNLKPGQMGGPHPLDFAPCQHPDLARRPRDK